jgi:hypothetical protein
VKLVLIRSVILVKGGLKFTLLPNSTDYLIIYLEFACPVLQTLKPSASKDFSVREKEGSSSVF